MSENDLIEVRKMISLMSENYLSEVRKNISVKPEKESPLGPKKDPFDDRKNISVTS